MWLDQEITNIGKSEKEIIETLRINFLLIKVKKSGKYLPVYLGGGYGALVGGGVLGIIAGRLSQVG